MWRFLRQLFADGNHTVLRAAIVSVLILLSSSNTATGMTMEAVTDDHRQLGYVNLWGDVVEGDAVKFRDVVLPLVKKGVAIVSVSLSSPGGLLLEAMDIGDQIRLLRARTRAPRTLKGSDLARCDLAVSSNGGAASGTLATDPSGSKCRCSSACFFIWASGALRDGNTLGIHRPHISTKSPADQAGLVPIYEADQALATAYLTRRRVPRTLIDKMFATSHEALYPLADEEAAAIHLTADLAFYMDVRCRVPVSKPWQTRDQCVHEMLVQQTRLGARDYIARYGGG